MGPKRYDGRLPQAGNSAWLLAGVGAPTYLILLLFFLIGVQLSVILVAMPLYALDLGASAVMLGSLVSGDVFAGALFSFLGAMLCDRFGQRSMILWAICAYIAASVVGMLAVSSLWLLLGAIMGGVGDMLFTVGGFVQLMEIASDKHRDLIISTAFSLLRAGSMAGSVLIGYIAERFGFSAVFLLGIVVGIVGGCLSFLLPHVNPEAGRASSFFHEAFESYKAAYDILRANKAVRLASVLTGLGTLGWFTFRSSFYLDYLHQLEMSVSTIGFLMALGSASMILAPFLYSLISRHTGALAASLFGLLVGGLALALTPFLTSALAIAFIGTLGQVGDAFRVPAAYSLLSSGTSSRERATSVAINNTFWAMAAFIGGPFWGLIAGTMGLSKTFLIVGLGTTLGAASLYVRNRHNEAIDQLAG